MASPPNMRKRIPFVAKLLLAANLLVILMLGAGFLAAFIAPDKNWLFAFAGLAFPFLALINVGFIPIWLIFRWKFALLPLIFMLIFWSRMSNYFQFGNDAQLIEESDIRVMTYNVRLFDLYNWKNGHISENAKSMFSLMAENQPDLLCIQEYHAGKMNKVDIADSIMKYSGLKYHQVTYVKNKDKIKPYGIATFSRWPIASNGIIRFEGNPFNSCIYSDIVMDTDTIRLFNIHLESIQLSNEDYLYVTDLKTKTEEQDLFSERSKKILRKLKWAFVRRAAQARTINKEVLQSPYPVIVCGDFNDTPSSFAYHTVAGKLGDAFSKAGNGLGQTYAGTLLPSFRIDYILFDKNVFETRSFSIFRETFSDHYPIQASFNFNRKE